MAWIIDKDHFTEGEKTACNANAVGLTGPSTYKGDGSELTNKFRMLTDDRDLVYEGRSSSNSSFGPLDNFGMPNFGCTIIEYLMDGKWVAL